MPTYTYKYYTKRDGALASTGVQISRTTTSVNTYDDSTGGRFVRRFKKLWITGLEIDTQTDTLTTTTSSA